MLVALFIVLFVQIKMFPKFDFVKYCHSENNQVKFTA